MRKPASNGNGLKRYSVVLETTNGQFDECLVLASSERQARKNAEDKMGGHDWTARAAIEA